MAIPAEGQAPIDESAPLGQNVWVLDYYTRSKVECERVLWKMADAGLPLDGDPAELAFWRARSDDRAAAGPGISPRAGADRRQGR